MIDEQCPNRLITLYLSVHHEICMAMVKCMLTRNVYLLVNIDFPKGAFISATLLRPHFYVPAGTQATYTSSRETCYLPLSP